MKTIPVSLRIPFLLFFLLFTTAPRVHTANVVVFKGDSINKFANLITLPNGSVFSSMDIQLACWIPSLNDDLYYVYAPRSKTCSLHEYSSIMTLPEIAVFDTYLTNTPLVSFDTDMGTIVPIYDWLAGIPDFCPGDPDKINPGTCGCSVTDTDTDGDNTPDCNDNCPSLSNANQIDSDGDGWGDACDPTLVSDLNFDKLVNLKDVITALQIASDTPVSETIFPAAAANKLGIIGVADAINALQVIASGVTL